MGQDIFKADSTRDFNNDSRAVIVNPSGGGILKVDSDNPTVTIFANETGRYIDEWLENRFYTGDTDD